ncbi:hypothetical protein [Solimonas flava]|uniref:hypothetical protein n=1 Tax=Solimonas flava TaxID=415849 RepID=UPI0003FDDB60|nr:hypothetical protein [Solimonas flava]
MITRPLSASILRLPLLALAGLLAACSYFSQTPEPDVVSRVHREVPIGLDFEEATARLSSLNFSCGPFKRGAYTDESGRDHEDARFMQCTKRPAKISFACENRDQVVLLPGAGGTVAGVEVTRGPDCQSR